MDYSNFNMIIDKRFMSYSYFYKKVIMNWLYYSEKEFENILIYSSDLELTKSFLIKISSEVEDYFKSHVIVTQRKYHDTFEIKIKKRSSDKEKILQIIIQSTNRIKLDQRGLKLSGIILDVNGKASIEDYLDDNLFYSRIFPYLLLPTDLDIGLTLYY